MLERHPDHATEAKIVSEILDGRLPPSIWASPGRWYPDASHDRKAVKMVEVSSASQASVRYLTTSRSDPSKIYLQFFVPCVDHERVNEAFENHRRHA